MTAKGIRNLELLYLNGLISLEVYEVLLNRHSK